VHSHLSHAASCEHGLAMHAAAGSDQAHRSDAPRQYDLGIPRQGRSSHVNAGITLEHCATSLHVVPGRWRQGTRPQAFAERSYQQ
jgi:hypothetical protein